MKKKLSTYRMAFVKAGIEKNVKNGTCAFCGMPLPKPPEGAEVLSLEVAIARVQHVCRTCQEKPPTHQAHQDWLDAHPLPAEDIEGAPF